ncbi:MAG: hypothetical protein PVI75_00710 [Gammaproteobacteria bacterium]|jgi:hypothetical protein
MATITKETNLRIGLVGCAAFFQHHREEAEFLVSNPNLQKKLDASEPLKGDQEIDLNEINYFR